MKKDKLCPIGSVIRIKKYENKEIMVIGKYLYNEEENKIIHYIGTFYPEGFINPDNLILFNHEEITEFIHEGYSDEESENAYNKMMNM